MAINLKEILISDVDNIKLDKVNYNFDQLVANGGGPQGFQGTAGEIGYQGVTGYQGNQGVIGNQGNQGVQGTNGQNIWKINIGDPNSSQADTLLPIHENLDVGPPSILIGYKSTDTEYTDYIEENSQVVINRNANFTNNLQLKNSGFSTSYVFKLTVDAFGNGIINTGFLDVSTVDGAESNSVNHFADLFTWGDSISSGAGNLITLNPYLFNVKIDTQLTDLAINGTLKVSSGADVAGAPAAGKIATASDNTGKITFKTLLELGGTVPLGTIVSMLPTYFIDNSRFVNQHSAVSPAAAPIEIYVGRGIGEYTGWYICNGKTWRNSAGDISFPTPDLNSFSYTITDDTDNTNANSQGAVSSTNDEISIIGGADAELNAVYNDVTSVFDITGTIVQTTDSFQAASGSTYTIKKLPQIIYLGEPDLVWSDAGTGAGETLPTYTFANWTGNGGGISSISQDGTINISLGNTSSPYYVPIGSVSKVPTSYSANTGTTAINRTVSVTVIVPTGFTNSTQNVTGTITKSQPTNYNPGPFTTTLNTSPSSASVQAFSPITLTDFDPSFTGNVGASGSVLFDLTVPSGLYRVGSNTSGVTWQAVSGTATTPVYVAGLIFNTLGYQNVPIGERFSTTLTIDSGDSNPQTVYTLSEPIYNNRDTITYAAIDSGTGSGNWTTRISSFAEVGTEGLNLSQNQISSVLTYIGLPYRTIEITVSHEWTGSGTMPLADPTITLTETTSTNSGALITDTVRETTVGNVQYFTHTIKTGIGSGTFSIVSNNISADTNVTAPNPGCQSYWVRAHATTTTTIVNYIECGSGNSATATVQPEADAYICVEVGAMTGGVDYIIQQGSSSQVLEDNSGINNCLTIAE